VSCLRKLESLLPGCGMPYAENKEYNKGVAPDPGSCTRHIGGCGSRTGAFCLYTDRCRARRHGQRTVRTTGRTCSPTALYPAWPTTAYIAWSLT